MKEKQLYSVPQLTVHGNVEDITQTAGLPNADSPAGNANSADPVKS
jgi:hypothetical protein